MNDRRLLFLHALTALHPGSGAALGVVDLPVQRERHTRWPLIPGSSLKGVLRAAASNGANNRQERLAVFGPETANAADHAGALALTDARLLAFPVRSLRGVFAWVTCPAVLLRFRRDAALAGWTDLPETPSLKNSGEALTGGKALLADPQNGTLILEEFDFKVTGDTGTWADRLSALVSADAETRARFASHVVILHDDDFTHFVEHACEVTARIGLDAVSKTVKQGALFYQELLPAESIFYSLVMATDSRRRFKDDSEERRSVPMTAAEVLDWVGAMLAQRPVLQIGADETIGRGLCAPHLVGAGT